MTVAGAIAAVLPLIAWHAASVGATGGAGVAATASATPPAAETVAGGIVAPTSDTALCPPDSATMTPTDPAAATTTTSVPTDDCASSTTTTVEPTLPPPVEPTLPPPVETTLPPPVETTLPPPVETTLPPPVETTVPPPVETTVPPIGETTVPTTETTVPPTVATTVPEPMSPTTVPAPTTTVPATVSEEEDPTSAPVQPAFEVPGGRVIVPAGLVDTGQLRPITFPVAGPASYGNDWGACRDECRRAHKGIDIIGVRLQPLLAMHDGTVDHLIDHPTAGFGIAIIDDEGWRYDIYHANNDAPGTDDGADDGTWRFAEGIVAGARVRAGQVIGWMGDSGNSEGSVPHAHVEIHLPGGTAINPYWSLRQAQRDVNCAVTATDDGTVADPAWMATGWKEAVLPGEWRPLELTAGGRSVTGRMWIGEQGYIPVDAGALFVGDPRYDEDVDCTTPASFAEIPSIPAELSAVLATIRMMESGGNYAVTITSSSASGAYAFIDAAWGGYGGYARAYQAPPPVQDQKAVEFASSILARNGGDVSIVPVVWYIGHVPVGAEWDTVPTVGANTLTPREYQFRWLRMYAGFVGSDVIATSAPMAWTPTPAVVCRTAAVDVGPPGAPQYVLTRASEFAADADGLAVIAPATTSTTTTTSPDDTTTTSTTTRPGATGTSSTTIPTIMFAPDGVTPVDPCDPTRPMPPAAPVPPAPPVDDDVTAAVRPRAVRPVIADS